MSGKLDKTSAKILVLGDSGVGKSSLIHLICHSTILTSAHWTIGCAIDVKLHGDFFLEFWEIGGSRSHKIARSFLLQDHHGIMCVFDSTNNKSRQNIKEWLAEVSQKSNFDVPMIKVGTKKDQLRKGWSDNNDNADSSVVNFESPRQPILKESVIYINTQDVFSFNTDSKNYLKLSNFFTQVIERRNNKFAI